MAIARQFSVDGGEFEGEVDREELHAALGDVAALLMRCGGSVYIAAGREHVADSSSEMVTTKVVFKWLSRDDTAPVAEKPAPLPDDVEAAAEQAEPVAA